MKRALIRALKTVASYRDWSGRWVHYTKTPYLKIHPEQFHQDPAGIYLFPEEFETIGAWDSYPYKFTVEVPADLKVLDLADMAREDVIALVKHCFGYINRDLTIEEEDQLEKAKNYQDRAWDMLRNSDFMYNKAKWNKALRDLGYDAVFDDTGSVHSAEVQLIVLHPRKLKVVGLEERSGTGFKEIEKVMKDLESEFAEYGTISSQAPRKKKEWGEEILFGTMRIENGDRYASLKIYPNKERTNIGVSLQYSKPRLGYGAGFEYNIAKNKYDRLDTFQKDLDKIFEG